MIKEAWLIFRSGKHRLQRFMKDGYGHVSIIYKDEFNWIFITPNEYDMEIVILPYSVEDEAAQWLALNDSMVVVRVVYNIEKIGKRFPRFLIGFTCVSFIKYFLGYKDFSVTPYQLLNGLMKCKKNIKLVEKL